MRSGYFLLVLMGLFIAPLYGQESYLSLSLGGSFPRADFAGSSVTGTDGFAGSSFTMGFDGTWFSGMLGAAATLNFGMSYLDDQALKEARISRLGEIYSQVFIPPDATIDFVSTQWTYVHLMAGPVFSVEMPLLNLEARALAGGSFFMPPVQELTVTSAGNTWTSNASGQSVRLGYLIGGAVLVHPNPGYGIRLGLDYLTTRAGYNVHYNLDQGALENNRVDEKESIAVNILHTTVGIFYNF